MGESEEKPPRRGRFVATLTCVLMVLLLGLNVPFYAGSSLGPSHSWRMEHGRLTVKQYELGARKSLWVDVNQEGLRWNFERHLYDNGDWTVTIPLWVPLLVCLAWCAWTWRRRDRDVAS